MENNITCSILNLSSTVYSASFDWELAYDLEEVVKKCEVGFLKDMLRTDNILFTNYRIAIDFSFGSISCTVEAL